jgi:GT2 family glycosyltransferase/SAM-dependent methyltransferase
MKAELERLDPAEQGGRILYEHLHRYALCREFVTGRRTLDLACGTGYGTAILGVAAAEVTGVDISAAAIRLARGRYASGNVKFVVGDCFDLPFEDDSFDVVVANEMIEHVEDHAGLLAEIRRVLVDKGVLLVSTPNKPVYNRYKTPNVFHVAEMEVPEFRKLLTDRFRHVRLTGTRMALLSVGYSLDPNDDHVSANLNAARVHLATGASDSEPQIETGELQLAEPEYVLAMCSDAPLEELALSSSIFFDERHDLWLEHEKIMAWASNLHEEDEVLRADVVRTRELLEEARAKVEHIEAERADIASRLEALSASQANLAGALESERNALAREMETIQREATARLSTLAELLGRMGRQPVAAEEGAIVSSLFQINEALVTEKLQRAQADERSRQLDSRIEALKADAAEIAAERARLLGELAARGEELSSERRQRENLEAARVALAEEKLALAEQLSLIRNAAADESQRLTSVLAARTGELETERQRREEVEAARSSLEEELRLAADQLSALRADAAEQGERFAAEIAARTGELEIERQRREEVEAAWADADAAMQEKAARLATLREQLEQMEAQSLAASEALKTREAELGEALAAERRARAELEASRTPPLPIVPRVAPAPVAPATEDRAAAALGVLHRRTAAMLASAPARVAGRIGPPPERAPLPWHRRVLSKGPVLETSIFSSAWLERQDSRLVDVSLRAFLANPRYRTLSPHPLFDPEYYLRLHTDVEESGMSPLVHYVLHGWREGRDPHPLFTNDWYLAQNPDVAGSGAINPLDHYLLHGWREGRRPNPLFDPRSYLLRYPDVEAGDFEPLTHFMLYGEGEGRELVIDGWSPSLPDVATRGGVLRVMEQLLREPAAKVPSARASGSKDGTATLASTAPWPPLPVDDFWPAPTMREMIAETRGEPLLSRIWYLLSLMNRWQDGQAEFATSEDCRSLLERVRLRATAKVLADDAEPSATVIIPVYNNVLDTLLCLASILELDERYDFEVIVADDGSTDATAALITTIGGNVRYVRQPRNLGFLGNCNAAATQARGRTIVLLNNDTLVFSGWLDGLLDPIADMPGVGLVGSKLINWDGTLQEAGGIFWRDGSAWNFGRNQDALAPEFNYLKDVDYCSGASIAVPAQIWREVGGFDPIYSPAYCEDSDLAFRLREAGYRTLYSPASEVVHHEGRSHGRDVTSGTKAHQVTNNARFLKRWRHVLERDHYPNAHNVLRARDRSFAKKHVLLIDHYVPQWDKDAGSRTLYQYMKILVDAGCHVAFWPDNLYPDPVYTPLLQKLGVEVLYGVKHRGCFPELMKERGELLDMVFVARPHIAVNYVNEIKRWSEARIVYYGVDVHFKRMEAALKLGEIVDPDDIASMRELELSVCRDSDVIFYPDPAEVELIEGLVGGDREFIANPIFAYGSKELVRSRAYLPGVAAKRGGQIVFVGGFNHPPNRDGVIWFANEVLPIVREKIPNATLDIIGSNAPRDVMELAGSAVRVRGFISDAELERAYRDSDVVVAPLRFGAGVKGKVIEAMSQAVPVATTSFGAQGISEPEQKLFLGDDVQGLARAVIEALEDRSEAMRRAGNALDFVQDQYSEGAVRDLLLRLTEPAAVVEVTQ